MLEEFDHKVIAYARSLGRESEEIYRRLDRYLPKYRESYTQTQLLEGLEKLKADDGEKAKGFKSVKLEVTVSVPESATNFQVIHAMGILIKLGGQSISDEAEFGDHPESDELIYRVGDALTVEKISIPLVEGES